MHPPPVRRPSPLGPQAPGRRSALLGLLLWLAAVASAPAAAQGVELATLKAARSEGALDLEFAVRITLPRPVEEALSRGVPVYFVAEATLYRNRWYWRDDRIARVSRSWRVAFQPLTGSWRVALGGLNQSHATLAEALLAVSSSSGWKLADLSQVDGKGHYVEFEYRLDTSQLPGFVQFGLGGQDGWNVRVERTLRVD
jgi:hypothetical protein